MRPDHFTYRYTPLNFSVHLLKRFMLLLSQDDSLSLVQFDRERAIPTERFAIASLDEGKAVIPVWLDVIYQRLAKKLGN